MWKYNGTILEKTAKNIKNFYDEIKDAYNPRDFQHDCFTNFKKMLMIFAPTGSGKTGAMVIVALLKAIYCKKIVLITFPYNSIGEGFMDDYMFHINMPTKYSTSVKSFVARFQPTLGYFGYNGTVDAMIERLREGWKRDPHQDVLVASNKTWIAVYKKLKKNNELHLIDKKVFEWIEDEFHHNNAEEDEEMSNELGKISKYFLENKIKLSGATATAFRADVRETIIPSFDGFKVIRYSKHDFMKDTGFKAVIMKYNFPEVDNLYDDMLRIYNNDLDAYNLFSVPHTLTLNARYGYDKYEMTDRISNEIIPEHRIIADLIEEDRTHRNDLYKEINKDNFSKKDLIHDIIAMNTFSEGSNWLKLNRIFIIGNRASRNQYFQLVGRIRLSDEFGVVWNIIPFDSETHKWDESKVRDDINNNLVSLAVNYILMDDMLSPNKTSMAFNFKEKECFEIVRTALKEQIIPTIKGKKNNTKDLRKRISEKIDEIVKTNKKEEPDFKITSYQKKKMIDNAIKAAKRFSGEMKETKKEKKRITNNPVAVFKKPDVREIPMNMIDDNDPMDFVRYYSSIKYDCDTLDRLQDMANFILIDRDDKIDMLIEWIDKNGYPRAFHQRNITEYEGTDEEKNWYSFIHTLKQIYNGSAVSGYYPLTDKQIAKLESIDGWYWKEITVSERVQELVDFIKTNNRIPHWNTKAKESEEGRIYSTYRRIRLAHNGSVINHNFTQEDYDLMETIEGYTWKKSSESIQDSKVAEIGDFFLKEKRLPSRRVYKTEHEKKLYDKVKNFRSIYKGMVTGKRYSNYKDISKKNITRLKKIGVLK